MTSAEAAAQLMDKVDVDFVYIDAAHNYSSVTEDLKLWSSKIKQGVLAGHDYCLPDVKSAVDEFVAAKNLSLNVLYGDKSESWWCLC